jgi:putative PEP-CTERM system histidine kinase
MSISVWSYGSAGAAYAVLTVFLLLGRRSEHRGGSVLFAVAGTALWGAAIALGIALSGGVPRPAITAIPDALRTLVLILFLSTALPSRGGWRSVKRIVAVLALLLAGAAIVLPFVAADYYTNLTLLGLSIVGCLTIEQLIRNVADGQRRFFKLFLRTIAGILIYDVLVFSSTALPDAIDANLWMLRGFIATAAVPLFLVSAKGHAEWTETLFISRDVVFYSATLTGVGIYLAAAIAAGLLIGDLGPDWSAAIRVAYLIAALGVLAYMLSSAWLRTQLRVFISKHFYRNRYDYREEWLRLTRALSDSKQDLPLDRRSVKALCAIVDSDGGQLWLDRTSRSLYEPFAAWQAPFPVTEYPEQSALVRFLKQTEWVIDTRQYAEHPEHYGHAFRDDPIPLPANSLIFALIHQNEMLGIVRLNCRPGLRELNYEDHDLLKTAGRQVAAVLAHDLAQERLTETRQFEAYNKLAAFVVHDLKNLLAQQALVVTNARKFRDRPEFIADVVSTVDSGVQRMRRMLRQLGQGGPFAQDQRLELNKLILHAVSACAHDDKAPCRFADSVPLWVRAQADQLTAVISHVIQNAQEATTNGGTVAISLTEAPNNRALIEVRDSGEGMSEEFIRRRLFKPFETTKGSAGMGIGAYQAREIVRSLGGEMMVQSEPGKGTIVQLFLPQARPPEPRKQPLSAG